MPFVHFRHLRGLILQAGEGVARAVDSGLTTAGEARGEKVGDVQLLQ